ncbi:TlpA family protein disulfide reductase [Microbacterium marinilacus]|uniref:TlpA disulfide reductase family protein n=2 Tax=Microbacterium marinilacus TaxID=415209 RepID=A0ABP7BMS6_9MICO|nr:TlpA family protein disulfide reductase [Microbacterium marinilacus]
MAFSACAPDPVTESYRNGENLGYVRDDFAVREIAAEQRGEPVVWSGTSDSGELLLSSDLDGYVVVVNFWYAECGPCIAEAPALETVWQGYQEQKVRFLGVNTSNEPATARAFAEENEVTYPSVIDFENGDVKLAFAAAIPISATPVTLVLDQSGRVAARIIGQLDGASILSTVVENVLAEAG